MLINGFVGFQLYEDGTTLSVWLLRLTSLAMFIIGGAISLLTFKNWAGMDAKNPIGIFVVTAFLTPPDAVSQVIMAAPMYLLYEFGLAMARVMQKMRREAQAADEEAEANT